MPLNRRRLVVTFSRARLALACATFGLVAMISMPRSIAAQRSGAEQAADSQFAQRQWSAAAAAYRALVSANSSSGLNWASLGECELQLKRYDEAIAAFAKAAELKYRPFRSIVDQARATAARGDDASARDLLQKVIDGGAGAALRAYIVGAPEFKQLIGSPSFTALVAQMKPCTTAPYRQFDFWIGEWEVQGPAGGVLGHNSVTLEQDGCLLVEHWRSAAGGETGTSFNYFDVRDKKWHQLYISNSGNAGAFPAMAGTLVDGKMVLLTDDVNNTLSRWTWYVMEPGKVKQMAELSNDHGATWSITWNSVYVRQPEARNK